MLIGLWQTEPIAVVTVREIQRNNCLRYILRRQYLFWRLWVIYFLIYAAVEFDIGYTIMYNDQETFTCGKKSDCGLKYSLGFLFLCVFPSHLFLPAMCVCVCALLKPLSASFILSFPCIWLSCISTSSLCSHEIFPASRRLVSICIHCI